MNTILKTQEDFINKIGSRIFLLKGRKGCNCDDCAKDKLDGFIIESKDHAEVLFDNTSIGFIYIEKNNFHNVSHRNKT
jgi:hypothetical protein